MDEVRVQFYLPLDDDLSRVVRVVNCDVRKRPRCLKHIRETKSTYGTRREGDTTKQHPKIPLSLQEAIDFSLKKNLFRDESSADVPSSHRVKK